MSATNKSTPNGTPFKAVSHGKAADKEALLAQLQALEAAEAAEVAEREAADFQRQTAEREADIKLLEDYRTQLDVNTEALKYVTDKNEVTQILLSNRKFEKGINEIESKYGISSAITPDSIAFDDEPAPRKLFGISSNKALWLVLCGFFIFALLSYGVGKLAAADPTNASAQIILNTFWLRLLVNFALTLSAFLFGAAIMYLFFPDAYGIWNNKVKSQYSVQHLIQNSPSWAVLLFVCFCFAFPIWVFVSLFEVIFV
ncbi:MAG: hypothetical protein EAZ80_01590 [Runella slithyformis]|nr:MAG: hypothetical protein EAZ80_01590 [Runella slithyformis]TAF48678.1 MAG: hypothetical protein EAZ63_03765 [Runella slithyformis]